MKLSILGSSSLGNSYLLHNDKEALLIECGVKFSEVKRAINFNVSKIVGCTITHSHKDHCKYVKEVVAAGIDVFASTGTIYEMGIQSHRLHAVAHLKEFTAGGFKIIPFDVKHDTREPLGFIVGHEEIGNLLFLTDSWYTPFKFAGLTNIMVECNYSEDIINDRLYKGAISPKYRNRVMQSHMELGTLKEMLKANDLRQVNNIILLHLSDGNSDSRQFQKEIEELTAKTVTIADSGMEISINKTPF